MRDDDRAVDFEAELVTLMLSFLIVVVIRLEIFGVEPGAPHEFVGRTVKLIGPRFQRHVNR